MFQVIFKYLRSGGNKSSYILKQTYCKKLQVCLSIYAFCYHQAVKGYSTTCYKFLDNFIEIWIKFGFEEKWKGISSNQLYFQVDCINVLRIAFFTGWTAPSIVTEKSSICLEKLSKNYQQMFMLSSAQ